jgi:hypothetical protein
LLALQGAHLILYVGGLRVNLSSSSSFVVVIFVVAAAVAVTIVDNYRRLVHNFFARVWEG